MSSTSFNAGDFEDLTYDFTKYGGGSGVIPEPTTDEIKNFYKSLKTKVSGVDVANVDKADPAKAVEKILSMDDDAAMAMLDSMTELCSTLCKGSPSQEELNKLPHRIKMAFVGWLMGTFTSPE